MPTKRIILCLLFLTGSFTAHTQNPYKISGIVENQAGETIPGINVTIKGTTTGTSTEVDGSFSLDIVAESRVLVFSGIGFAPLELKVDQSLSAKPLNIRLKDEATLLNAVEVIAESNSSLIEKRGFSVEAIETQKLKAQSLELNNVLGRTAGVRVRRSGGTGSDFTYSLDGMSGNAIRFFIDGIPMDYFGSSYSVNNLPIALIKRVDLYKGVVPVELGSDALGGAINLVTNQSITNYAAASYSIGSFNTHQATLHGQWRSKSGLTTRLSTFYTYSDNNYKVWGQGVHYADASTGFRAIEFTRENPAERFNDDFETTSIKFDLGFTEKKWADQFFLGLLATDQKKGVQTAQTMARVFGKVRYNEQVLMPSLTYQKRDLIAEGLDVSFFAAYSLTEGHLIDTSTVQYDWRADSIGYRLSGGEMGYDGKSLFSLQDEAQVLRFNATYPLPSNFKLGLNYLYSSTKRIGEDPFTPTYRIPYLEAQNVGSHFAGLSLETTQFQDKLHANVFLKYYGYDATINDVEYTDQWVVIKYQNKVTNWGAGYAASYKIFPKLLLKSSIEQATRMPSPTEALGDGVTVSNNPLIEPEQSFNVNLGPVFGRYNLGARHGVKIALNTFFRDVKDKLLFTIIDGQGNGEYRNIDRISGTGAEVDLIYDFDQKLKLNLNGTYLDLRNNLQFDEEGRANIVYRDRMRNVPYLMANAGLEYNLLDVLQRNSKLFVYFQSAYVHQFFLGWPSLASKENKSFIPTQLVFDTGIGYTFPSKKLALAIDVSNLLNEQVYDNYLLQKPGRAIFLKINYQIK